MAVQQGCIVIWRLIDAGSASAAWAKYLMDDSTADDRQLSDTDYYEYKVAQDAPDEVLRLRSVAY